jgi:hypothetical protein
MVLPVRIQGANLTLAKDQAEYTTLHGRFTIVDGAPQIEVAFQLEVEEIKLLLEGGTLVYTQLGRHFAPMQLRVEPAADPVDMSKAPDIKPAR